MSHDGPRLSVEAYHRLIELGILTTEDRVELLEGYLVAKDRQTPAHATSVHRTWRRIEATVGDAWTARIRFPVTLADSEPEPDVAVARGDNDTYAKRHPGPMEVGLVVEVADTEVVRDRGDKARIYASASIPIYWIVNLVDRQVEVYTSPSGPGANPSYAQQQAFPCGASLPLVLDGAPLGTIVVADLLA